MHRGRTAESKVDTSVSSRKDVERTDSPREQRPVCNNFGIGLERVLPGGVLRRVNV